MNVQIAARTRDKSALLLRTREARLSARRVCGASHHSHTDRPAGILDCRSSPPARCGDFSGGQREHELQLHLRGEQHGAA